MSSVSFLILSLLPQTPHGSAISVLQELSPKQVKPGSKCFHQCRRSSPTPHCLMSVSHSALSSDSQDQLLDTVFCPCHRISVFDKLCFSPCSREGTSPLEPCRNTVPAMGLDAVSGRGLWERCRSVTYPLMVSRYGTWNCISSKYISTITGITWGWQEFTINYILWIRGSWRLQTQRHDKVKMPITLIWSAHIIYIYWNSTLCPINMCNSYMLIENIFDI